MQDSAATSLHKAQRLRRNASRFLLAALAFAALALGTACSFGESPGNSSGDQPDGLAFDKTQVNLGSMDLDSRGFITFLAINYGGLPVTVGPVEVETVQGESAGKSVQGGTERVNPMDAYPVRIAVGPFNKLGPHRIRASIASSDPTAKATVVTANFTVVEGPGPQVKGPRLRVDKQSIDIGTVPYNWPLYEQFTLRNDGDAPLVLAATPTVRIELGC